MMISCSVIISSISRHCEASPNPPNALARLSQIPTTTTTTTIIITTIPPTTTPTTAISCEDGDGDDDDDDDADDDDFYLSGLRHNLFDENADGDSICNGGAGAAGINMMLTNQGHVQPVLCNNSAL